VKYREALWQLTLVDCREQIFGRPWRTIASSGMVFLAAAVATGFIQGLETIEPFVLPVLIGLGGVVLYFAGMFLTFLLYLTPKKLCEAKQYELDQAREELTAQLEQQRLKYKSDILAEKAATRKVLDELDEWQRGRDERARIDEVD
jgi:hypothetical protein